jgi:hypothetical protein
MCLENATTVTRKQLILKNWPENIFSFFFIKASGGFRGNFIEIDNDFGAGLLRVSLTQLDSIWLDTNWLNV